MLRADPIWIQCRPTHSRYLSLSLSLSLVNIFNALRRFHAEIEMHTLQHVQSSPLNALPNVRIAFDGQILPLKFSPLKALGSHRAPFKIHTELKSTANWTVYQHEKSLAKCISSPFQCLPWVIRNSNLALYWPKSPVHGQCLPKILAKSF